MNVLRKDEIFLKFIFFATHQVYLFRYRHVNSAPAFSNLDLHRATTFEQCKLPRPYLPDAIDYDYFMVE